MPTVIVVGGQWGDEGKGKVVDLLTGSASLVVRSQGGNNAGHTIVIGEIEYKLHLVPTGILHPNTGCYIAAGTVIDPEILLSEIQSLESKGLIVRGRLHVSPFSHVIFSYHKKIDELMEKNRGNNPIGTTKRGIGPCYTDKARRIGIRLGQMARPDLFPQLLRTALDFHNEDLVKKYQEPEVDYNELLKKYSDIAGQLRPYVDYREEILFDSIEKKENILFEGAQGALLDLDTGTYPFVTSSSTLAAGLCAGAGLGPSQIDYTLGVFKAYTTRVGSGPLPTEIPEEEIFLDHQTARELGTTTRRIRRIGWFDAVQARASVRRNGLNALALMKLDILNNLKEIRICTSYELHGERLETPPCLTEDLEQVKPCYETLPGWQSSISCFNSFEELPENCQKYIRRIEELCRVPVEILSFGPEREQTLVLHPPFPIKEQPE